MLSERRRQFNFEHLSKIFLDICKSFIDTEALCDYSDIKSLLGSDSTVLCLTIITLTVQMCINL